VSEKTAQLVDAEVSRVISTAYNRAKDVLTQHIDLLHTVAAALLDRETLTREDIAVLMRGEQLTPRPPAVPPTPPPAATPVPASEPRRVPPLLGGPEIAPA
jgi:cell division protease FtsH